MHSHTHNDGHNHSHSVTSNNIGKMFFFAAALNIIFIVVEIIFGYIANSSALVADATHNISDVLGLFLSWGALVLSQKIPRGKYTYGFKPATTLSVILSSSLLFVAVGGIIWNALHTLSKPVEVASGTIMVVALVGVAINGLSAYLLSRGNHDLNVKSAFIHLLGDALVSFAVVIAGIIIHYTGMSIVDPIVSILISLFILYSGWSVLKEGVNMSLHAVPNKIDIEKVRKYLQTLPNVTKVHDLHIWSMSTTETVLTAHLVAPNGSYDDTALHKVAEELKHDFHIDHTTIQIEKGEKECELAPDEVV